ncbi:MAG: response regulator transcription factor [Noviherbaspirillum sp.]
MSALLIVEDDRDLARGLASSLAQSGYLTDVVHGGHAALEACQKTAYQLVILDLGLPDLDGISVLRRLRQDAINVPVLVLTARLDVDDRVLGLDAGGDDYLAKPFALSEVEARIRALLRRSTPGQGRIRFSELVFDLSTREAAVGSRQLVLTASELAVLELLLRRPGKVVSKSQLIDSLYEQGEGPNPSMIEVFVSRLRRKLNEAQAQVHIRALRGLGYRLEISCGE